MGVLFHPPRRAPFSRQYLLLLAFSTPAALGDYQYAVRLASMLNLVAESATLTLLPKMTAKIGAEEIAGYTRRSLRRLAVILIPLSTLAFLFRRP